MPPGIALKRSPKLWEACKDRACTQGRVCQHSARKMQWATRCYKDAGGTYVGKKSSEHNKLAKWTRQRWRTHSGRKSAGKLRYLPTAAWKRLSPDQIRRTNAAKRRGFRQGRQYVAQPADVVRITSLARG